MKTRRRENLGGITVRKSCGEKYRYRGPTGGVIGYLHPLGNKLKGRAQTQHAYAWTYTLGFRKA